MDVYIDRTSIEVFIDDGLYSYSMERRRPIAAGGKQTGFEFWGTEISVTDLRLNAVESIWQ